MRRANAIVVVALCALMFALTSTHARATQEPQAQAAAAVEAASPRWQFQIMPYVWASGMTGSIRPIASAPTVSFSRSFSDTLEDIDAAFFLSAGAQRGRIVALGDFSRVATSRSGVVPPGLPAEGGTTQTTLTLAGGYKALVGRTYSIDVFAGLRAFWLEADLTVGGGALSVSPRRSFVDPVIGARASARLAPSWSGALHFDVGGFGAGTDSTVVLSALANYHLGKRFTFSGGYRSMWIDYDSRGTLVDVTIAGPILGASVRF